MTRRPRPTMHGRDHSLDGPDPMPGSGNCAVYSISDTLTTSTGGLRWYALADGAIHQIWASAGTAPAGSDIGVRVNRNGASIATLSIPAGAHDNQADDHIVFAAGDYFTVDVTSVGSTTPGSDLVVQLRMSGGT